jgi:hypothetical protein
MFQSYANRGAGEQAGSVMLQMLENRVSEDRNMHISAGDHAPKK